jgi:protein-S-isoprenylcysteine O-methyltransferase Ste14
MESGNYFFLPSVFIASLATFALAASVAQKFLEKPTGDKWIEEKCPVATLTMTLFFTSFVFLMRFHLGVHAMTDFFTNGMFFLIGVLLTTGSAYFNIRARAFLRGYWSDTIVIHTSHIILKNGPFSRVRHPLYASLILFGFGLSFLFLNIFMLALTLLVFIPMMVYRARHEETHLSKLNDPQYVTYRRNVPFLLPFLTIPLQWSIRWLGIIIFLIVLLRSRFTLDEVALLAFYFWLISFFISIPKVRFSYRMKGFVLLSIYAVSLIIPKAFIFYYFIFAMAVIGMRYNCPAMVFYLKLHPENEEIHEPLWK